MKTLRDSMKQKAIEEAAELLLLDREIEKQKALKAWLEANPQIGMLIREGTASYYNSTTLEAIEPPTH